MKRVIKTPIFGMALINPKLQMNTTISVEIFQKDEGPIPHIHVYTDKSREHCALVRLDAPKYADHHDNNHPENCTLNQSEKDQLINILSTVWRKYAIELADGSYRPATGYEAAVQMWLDAFGEPSAPYEFIYDKSGAPIMPDYSKL